MTPHFQHLYCVSLCLCVSVCVCVFFFCSYKLNTFFCCLETLSLGLAVLLMVTYRFVLQFLSSSSSLSLSFILFLLLSAHFIPLLCLYFSLLSFSFLSSFPPRQYPTLFTFLTMVVLFAFGWKAKAHCP